VDVLNPRTSRGPDSSSFAFTSNQTKPNACRPPSPLALHHLHLHNRHHDDCHDGQQTNRQHHRHARRSRRPRRRASAALSTRDRQQQGARGRKALSVLDLPAAVRIFLVRCGSVLPPPLARGPIADAPLAGMLWVMIIVWLAQGQPYYPSMGTHQRIAYISDIGADVLKPLFATGCCLTAVFFFASLLSMRRNHALIRRLERTLDVLSLVAGSAGAVCLVLLAAFDTRRHPSLHRLFLLLFMTGVVFSALFTTIEYRRLGKTFTQHTVLGWSYRFKQGIVAVEVVLSVAFGVTMYRKLHDTAAILEWCEFSPLPHPLKMCWLVC